jgi:hypothetical protein
MMPAYQVRLKDPYGDRRKTAETFADDPAGARENVMRTEQKLADTYAQEPWKITRVTELDPDG